MKSGFSAALAIALTLAACNSTPQPPPPQAATPAPPDPATLGVSAGTVGSKLDENDRRAAGLAQLSAIESGTPKSWRGRAGAYGFIEPGKEGQRAEGVCRDYSHTIYVDGRPQTGKGLACKGQNGGWRILS